MSRRRIDPTPQATNAVSGLTHRDRTHLAVATGTTVTAGVIASANGSDLLTLIVSAFALAALATLLARAASQVGQQVGIRRTLPAALSSVPVLIVLIQAISAGQFEIAKATIVGGVLANVLLVPGIATILAGRTHSVVSIGSGSARRLAILLLLGSFATLTPSFAATLHGPASGNEIRLSQIMAVLLLLVATLGAVSAFTPAGNTLAASVAATSSRVESRSAGSWPFALAVGVGVLSLLGIVVDSAWLINSTAGAAESLNTSMTLVGLVVVAIAATATENLTAFSRANRGEVSHSTELGFQAAVTTLIAATPIAVLLSGLLTSGTFALILPAMMMFALLAGALIGVLVVLDTEVVWLEGAALITAYLGIIAAFWWG